MRRTNSMSFFTRVWGHVVHGSGRWRWRKARAQKAGVAAMARARDPWRRRCSWSITAPSSVLTA